jgi:hypothetical protein
MARCGIVVLLAITSQAAVGQKPDVLYRENAPSTYQNRIFSPWIGLVLIHS